MKLDATGTAEDIPLFGVSLYWRHFQFDKRNELCLEGLYVETAHKTRLRTIRYTHTQMMTMKECLPGFVEVNIETAWMLRDGLTRDKTEPRDNAQPDWVKILVDRVRSKERVQLLDDPSGLRVHFTEEAKSDVFEAVEAALDSDNQEKSPHNLYDPQRPSKCEGYYEVLEFSLKRDYDNPNVWTVPRFAPKTLFSLLKPYGDQVRVISLADPLKGYNSCID